MKLYIIPEKDIYDFKRDEFLTLSGKSKNVIKEIYYTLGLDAKVAFWYNNEKFALDFTRFTYTQDYALIGIIWKLDIKIGNLKPNSPLKKWKL